MDNKNNQDKPVSRIIRDRAMAILRDTRAKIDPAVLSVMKEKLSPLVMTPPPSPKPAASPAERSSETEPVDKQKIATIVLEYMKNREDKNQH